MRMLGENEALGLIVRDGSHITIPKLTKHQKIDRRWFKTCDLPGCNTPSKPGEKGETTPEPQRVPDVPTAGPQRGHDESETCSHDELNCIDVVLNGSDGDVNCLSPASDEADSDKKAKEFAPEIHDLCEHLADWIERNGSKRPNITPTWLIECERLNRIDGYTHEQIRFIIDWSQRNTFWRSNILSMPTLRKKFDQLRLRSVEEHEKNRQQAQPPLSRSDQLYIAEMQRLHAEEQAQPGQLTIEGSSL